VGTAHRTRLAAISAAGLLAALAACGSSSTSGGGATSGAIKTGPGVDASTKTITTAIITPLSGQVAIIGKPLTAGQEAYFQAVNAKGGVDGWKINYVEKDDQYNPQTHVQLYNEVVGSSAFIAQSLGSPTTKAIEPLADQAHVLTAAVAQSSSFTTDPVMIVIGTPYSIDVANSLSYIVDKLGKRDAKIGIIYQNDEYGQDGLRGYTAAHDASHFNDVARATYNVTDTDFTAQVVQMKNAGAQYVIVNAVPKPAATIVGTGAAIGYFPQWVFLGPAWSEYLMTDNGTLTGKPTQVNQVLAKTVWVMGYQPDWGDTTAAGMTPFLADQQKYSPAQAPDYYFMYGYTMAQVEVAILKKAIESGDLTRDGLLNARKNLGHFSFGGLLPDLTYTPSLGPADRQTLIKKVDVTVPAFLKTIQPLFESNAAKTLK